MYINNIYSKNENCVLLKNNSYKKVVPKDNPYYINKEFILINLKPTFNYLQKIEKNNYSCYYKDVYKYIEGYNMKINSNSKYSEIKSFYQNLDKDLEKIGNNCINECSECCMDTFYISETEYFYMLSNIFLEKKYYRLLSAYKKAIKEAGYIRENFPYVYEDILREYNPDEMKYYGLGMLLQNPEKCSFLKNGKCLEYKSRPIICRLYGSYSYCEIANNKKINYNSNDILRINRYMYKDKMYYPKNKPIWYWQEKYLNPKNLLMTYKVIRAFIENDKEDFFTEYCL